MCPSPSPPSELQHTTSDEYTLTEAALSGPAVGSRLQCIEVRLIVCWPGAVTGTSSLRHKTRFFAPRDSVRACFFVGTVGIPYLGFRSLRGIRYSCITWQAKAPCPAQLLPSFCRDSRCLLGLPGERPVCSMLANSFPLMRMSTQ